MPRPNKSGKPTSAAKIAANARYSEKMVVQFKIGLNKKTDAAIIEHLQAQENKQGYIKNLIISDMKGGDNE